MLLYTFGSSLNSWAVLISLMGWAVNERQMGFDGYDSLGRIFFAPSISTCASSNFSKYFAR
jgi:hypothetical protein